MKNLKISQICSKNFFLVRLPKFRWGSVSFFSKMNIFCFSNNFAFLNNFFLLLNLKKIVFFVNEVAFKKGICLSYFLDRFKELSSIKEIKVKNFYFAFINKMFGFISNFSFFLKNLKHFKDFSNYNSKRLPSIIFLTKKVWKNFDFFILLFVRLRLITIKSVSFLDSEFSGSYDIFIGKCFSFYNLLRTIYFLNDLKFRKW
jgi:hypothetical protein